MTGNRRVFGALDGGGYQLTLADDGVRVEVRHLRREHHQLFGEVQVSCDWHVARTIDGILTAADLNLSSQPARAGRAKYCADRARTRPDDFDWHHVIDDVCTRVIAAESAGHPPLMLDDAPDHGPERLFSVHGLTLPADSHSLLVCDGDGLKSMTLLLVLGTLAQRGVPCLYLDWEWNAARHKQRKQRLFGTDRIEHLYYRRGRNPLAVEVNDIRRACTTHAIQFLAIDSIGACVDGKLADDDVARAYNRALDQLPPSLAAAHTPKHVDKASDAAMKPFGSAFFNNYTRMSWKLTKQVGASDDVVTVLYTPGKQNDGTRLVPVALEFSFAPDRIRVRSVETSGVEGFAHTLPLHARLAHLLKAGPMTIAALAEALDAKPDSVEKAVKRQAGKMFTCVTTHKDGVQRWGLLERRTA